VDRVGEFLERVTDWANSPGDIEAAALVGSYARGNATESSDVDLVLLILDPQAYLADVGWADQFGKVERLQTGEWGRVRPVRDWYSGGPEVGFGFTDTTWGLDASDRGIKSVIVSGIQAVCEKDGCLTARVNPAQPKGRAGP